MFAPPPAGEGAAVPDWSQFPERCLPVSSLIVTPAPGMSAPPSQHQRSLGAASCFIRLLRQWLAVLMGGSPC